MLLFGLAFAAQTWTPTCTTAADTTVWMVMEASAPVVPAEFTCPGLFLGGVACDHIVGLATVRTTDYTPRLAWLPTGEEPTVLDFLDKGKGGVALGSTEPTTTRLIDAWLTDRSRASAPAAGVTLHLWVCPEAPALAPDTPGILTRVRTGRVVLR